MKKMTLTGTAVTGLGLFLGFVTACGGSDGSTGGGLDGPTGSGESTTSQEGDSSGGATASSDGEPSSSGSDGESATTGEGSGGSPDGETSSTDGEGSGGSEGGETTTDGEGSGGSQGGETSSTDGEAAGNCPEERPDAEAGCEMPGTECSYEVGCATQTVVCREGQWRNQPSDAAGLTCDSVAEQGYPNNGDSCECAGELRCVFSDCEQRGRITAVCNGETWTVEASACEGDGGGDGTRCGPGEGDSALFCEAGEVCVASQAGEETNFDCAENPCVGLATSCECAAELCGETDQLECQIREEGLVVACVAPSGDGGAN